ncbi:ATP-binding protein [Methanothermobacter sp. K4]|uniref:ATP-binding protein n=1 Tax=Methanothermobacter sp. K4 TaxID=2913262 RepID=UPI001EDC1E1D|nr:ATP-binding protein [Methanothermobacter sp. K4]MCG2828509.1 ATP-binding protein [Methanothermobacter sp. K4]
MPIISLNRTDNFFGREKEIRRIKEALNDPGFVILTGRMGSGKTAILRRFHGENPNRTTFIDMRCTDIRRIHEGIPDFRRITVLARTVEWNVLLDSMSPERSAFTEAWKMSQMHSMSCAVAVRYSEQLIRDIQGELPLAAVVEVPPLTERETEMYIRLKAPGFRAVGAGIAYIHEVTEGMPLFIDSFLNVLSDGIIYGPALLEENFQAKFQQIAFPWIAELNCLTQREKGILSLLKDGPLKSDEIPAESSELDELELRGFIELHGDEWSIGSELLRRVIVELENQTGCI